MCGKDQITAFSPPRRCCEERLGLFKCQSKSIKRFSMLWRPREIWTSLFMCGKDLKSRFKLPGGDVKHVRACLSTKEDRENSFHHCGGPLRLVQDCLCAGKN